MNILLISNLLLMSLIIKKIKEKNDDLRIFIRKIGFKYINNGIFIKY